MINSIEEGRQPKPKQGPLIFVVDDEPMVGRVVEAMLALEGYRTRAFNDPHEALKALEARDGAPSALLADYLMPGMNGMELIEQAKKIRPKLKTVLFSGHFKEDITTLHAEKPDRFLIKPFHARELIGLVKAILE